MNHTGVRSTGSRRSARSSRSRSGAAVTPSGYGPAGGGEWPGRDADRLGELLLRAGVRSREPDAERGAAARRLLDADVAAHRLDQTLDDRETEAEPLTAHRVEPLEAIEHALPVRLRHASAGVEDGARDV